MSDVYFTIKALGALLKLGALCVAGAVAGASVMPQQKREKGERHDG